uniref:Staphylococcal nuclease domain-containing protein 1 n=1 Tax=Caenorhabditis japonica TaxID=281687 RepID=A0A8R1HJY3_CAEJA
MTDAASPITAPAPPPPAASSSTTSQVRRGLVKSVLSGDAIVLQGQPQNGPPPEFTVYLSNVTAPRLGRRPTDSSAATPDEPYAWESREFLRKKIVGQFVTFVRDFTATSGRDHGHVYLGGTSPADAGNVAETSVAAGFLEVRQGKVTEEYTSKLLELQEQAKSAGKGKWSTSAGTIREVRWVIENPREIVDKYNQKPVDAVVEMVRDGSTVRAFLLPDFEYITLQLSGVRAPSTRNPTSSESRAEPFSEEAKFFTESRLLQRDVQIVLESTSNQNFVGSVLHPKGNIAESLLREGYAKCVDWSIGLCTGGAEKLRAAERQAKEKRLRLWKGYQPAAAGYTGDRKAFTAKVTEVVLSDAVVVQKDDGTELKLHLSSIRLPRESGDDKTPAVGRQFRPLYDIPFMFQAREFLRKRILGKKVQIQIDYVQPKSENFPEKTCATIKVGDLNIAEGLVSRGLSKVVRHRADDENRSSEYDTLLAAEANAEKGKKGLFADKSAEKKDTLRIQEIAGDIAKSKQFLPYLQRGGRAEGVVEFISGGSRLRIYIPKETVLITFLLGGINCPKGARVGPGGVTLGASEPFADEAAAFTRKLILQHEVQLEVESTDKNGNFVGYLFVSPDGNTARGINLSEALVENGLASLHFTAERSGHYNALLAAENKAKKAKKNIWANFVEEQQQEEVEVQQADTSERKQNLRQVAVTDLAPGSLRFYAQNIEDGAKIEKMTSEMRQTLSENPPIAGSFTARRGDLCIAKFSQDGQWYRAKVESIRAGQAEVFYIDYGNRETIEAAKLAQIPGGFASVPAGAKEYNLALVKLPNEDYVQLTFDAFAQYLFGHASIFVNTEYRVGTADYVTAYYDNGTKKVDIGRALVAEGLALSDSRREPRLQTLVSDYKSAEETAKKSRKNIWEFGDFTGNEI